MKSYLTNPRPPRGSATSKGNTRLVPVYEMSTLAGSIGSREMRVSNDEPAATDLLPLMESSGQSGEVEH